MKIEVYKYNERWTFLKRPEKSPDEELIVDVDDNSILKGPTENPLLCLPPLRNAPFGPMLTAGAVVYLARGGKFDMPPQNT